MDDALSDRQQRMLDFIRIYLSKHGYPPSNREIGRATGISSTSVVDYNLRRLERKGHLTCDAKVSRGIKLSGEQIPVMAVAGFRAPVVGRIAAGKPIEAIENSDEAIQLTPDLAQEGCYVLKVKGTSMIEDLIADGDMVVVKPQPAAQNGDIVVAVIDEDEATLKRFYHEPGKGPGGSDRIRLQPANSEMEPIFRAPHQVKVRGKVVTVIRQVK
jgi:repressor LexA